MDNERRDRLIREGLEQFNNEALLRIQDHEGEMLLDGRIYESGVG